MIVPTEHVASTRQVDEQVWTEMRNFKKCLLQMHMAQVIIIITIIKTLFRLMACGASLSPPGRLVLSMAQVKSQAEKECPDKLKE